MAPKRKPRDANNSDASASIAASAASIATSAASIAAAATRVTRRSPRLANASVATPAADPEPPKRKKPKTVATKKKVETIAESPPSPAEQEPASERETVDSSKTIIVEHCKQCNSFKTRAIQVKLGLEKGVEGVKVVVNPEKPRRGCFEIREEGGGIFVSLLDLKRPFKPMKDLDMEKVISDIVEKIR
ncbi:hypothetical protein CASFOL_010584 [Castilleja foliolosa]|uniref:Selenoprotein H n=1 Tax=Castilleja foliolosa TaxID=1961234 RepID=A0ABD3DU63_9LAMI